VHLCCQKCADAATDAVKAVAGVTKYDIVSKAESFTVEGEFAKADLVAALNSAGFAGDIK
jgi:copper chaperone CopZ